MTSWSNKTACIEINDDTPSVANEDLDCPILNFKFCIQLSKPPGINGVNIQFFKTYSVNIVPYLTTLFN